MVFLNCLLSVAKEGNNRRQLIGFLFFIVICHQRLRAVFVTSPHNNNDSIFLKNKINKVLGDLSVSAERSEHKSLGHLCFHK